MEKISAVNLTKIFGPHPERALKLLSQGTSKDDIFNQTGQAVGLADVSFEVPEGEILVVMGLSGSGKSTLIRSINRLIEPTSGQIFIDGEDITTLDHDELLELRRHKFGMVFQHFALFPHRNILNNVEYGLEIQKVDKELRQEKARDALKLVGLEGWEDAKPSQLSGGMQQRVGLARALAVDPDILLMDEAFSALDPLIRGDMQNELNSLQDRMKKTILFITHDLDEALKIGNRVVLMKDGQVVQVGTPEEILMAPANDYVRRFVENVDKSKVLTAKSVLTQARVVAYPDDNPRTVLDKMNSECLSGILVVKHDDNTLQGMVQVKAASAAVERGDKSIASLIQEKVPTVTSTAPLTTLISILVEWPWQVPVVDEERQLQGVIVYSGVLAALAKRENI
ncbi:MAG: glycine/betaine ABC transporter ATP-binding protein [Candidatus Parabeggiatoa sp. nov. 2]|nr:MAG: glycine/betaine ABC transporter ATP-binding protein [Beggiatoa sp. 4572_84]RKZ64457.1 MAG: glycine/betaine ABC transporter ATP-binding protein [Gammaproteobacteria bacterium]HEC84700.1 glycine betaine/L-proline ABC transporter ATP-binding protein [Thioploca sp.]